MALKWTANCLARLAKFGEEMTKVLFLDIKYCI